MVCERVDPLDDDTTNRRGDSRGERVMAEDLGPTAAEQLDGEEIEDRDIVEGEECPVCDGALERVEDIRVTSRRHGRRYHRGTRCVSCGQAAEVGPVVREGEGEGF